jgi:hypothetical protein
LLGILQNINRDFIEGFESLFGVWTERFHALVCVTPDRLRRYFEIEPAFMDDAEKGCALVEPVTAEHRAASQASQIGELVQHEVLEAVVRGRHEGSSGLARRDYAHGDR